MDEYNIWSALENSAIIIIIANAYKILLYTNKKQNIVNSEFIQCLLNECISNKYLQCIVLENEFCKISVIYILHSIPISCCNSSSLIKNSWICEICNTVVGLLQFQEKYKKMERLQLKITQIRRRTVKIGSN